MLLNFTDFYWYLDWSQYSDLYSYLRFSYYLELDRGHQQSLVRIAAGRTFSPDREEKHISRRIDAQSYVLLCNETIDGIFSGIFSRMILMTFAGQMIPISQKPWAGNSKISPAPDTVSPRSAPIHGRSRRDPMRDTPLIPRPKGNSR